MHQGEAWKVYLIRRYIKKKDPQADLTGSKTGTVDAKITNLFSSCNFIA